MRVKEPAYYQGMVILTSLLPWRSITRGDLLYPISPYESKIPNFNSHLAGRWPVSSLVNSTLTGSSLMRGGGRGLKLMVPGAEGICEEWQ